MSRRRTGVSRELSPEREAMLPGILPAAGLGGLAPLSPSTATGARLRRAPRRWVDGASLGALRHLVFDDGARARTCACLSSDRHQRNSGLNRQTLVVLE